MKAPEFHLLGVDGKRYGPITARGENGLLVMFLCNHCPYVKRSIERIVRECGELAARGIGALAVMSNDPRGYPEDSFDNMKRVAAEKRFPFPYVVDETQEVARAYGAVCTPEFFGFNAALELQYHGRVDEMFEAMALIAETGAGPKEQKPSIGCSIKWKKT